MNIAYLKRRSMRSFGVNASTKWLPIVVLPAATLVLSSDWPAWLQMWGLAVAFYVSFKWLTWHDEQQIRRTSLSRSMQYLFLWPGMDAARFLGSHAVRSAPGRRDWLWAISKILLGGALIGVVVPRIGGSNQVAAAWTGMVGLMFVLHFGSFQLLSLFWRRRGVDARPFMGAPVRSTSLSEFWGRRWNTAFRDLSHRYLFRPLVGRFGGAETMLAVFVVSGLIHDAVISIPARAGYGLPTLYFVIQGFGMLCERSRVGRRVGFGRGWTGWVFCAVVILTPVSLLFHSAFVTQVIIPMLKSMGCLP